MSYVFGASGCGEREGLRGRRDAIEAIRRTNNIRVGVEGG